MEHADWVVVILMVGFWSFVFGYQKGWDDLLKRYRELFGDDDG